MIWYIRRMSTLDTCTATKLELCLVKASHRDVYTSACVYCLVFFWVHSIRPCGLYFFNVSSILVEGAARPFFLAYSMLVQTVLVGYTGNTHFPR